MNTFCAVNDAALVQLIQQARRRIVYIAPGLYLPVAKALCAGFEELGTLDVTLILDPDEEVCRIGFGELEALQAVHKQSARDGFFVREQPGLRVGVLLADDQTLVWSPTPRAVEAPPEAKPASTPAASMAPNGLLLGANPGEQIARAACAEGTHTDPRAAEIGTAAVTPVKVAQVTQALKDNPPIPVDLARVTRVFSTKLQFVELKAKGANLARRKLSIASALLNVDADAQLRDLLDSRLRAFGDFKDRKVDVPVYHAGKPAIDQNQKPMLEPVSEATLTRERRGIEHEFPVRRIGLRAPDGTLAARGIRAATRCLQGARAGAFRGFAKIACRRIDRDHLGDRRLGRRTCGARSVRGWRPGDRPRCAGCQAARHVGTHQG